MTCTSGEGSRLVRPCKQAESDITDSSVEPGGAAQSALSPRAADAEGLRAAATALSPHHDEGLGQDQDGPDTAALNTADRPRHRLSRVTGTIYRPSCYDHCRLQTFMPELSDISNP